MERIRLATPSEARLVLALWARAGSAPSVTDDEPSVRRVAERDALLVAEVDGAIVGSLVAAFDGWRGNLYRLAVDPEHRRRGIAQRLAAHAHRHLADQGCARISALVLRDERGANAFWDSAGYRAQEEIRRYVTTARAD